jgi:hypothetical protein
MCNAKHGRVGGGAEQGQGGEKKRIDKLQTKTDIKEFQ